MFLEISILILFRQIIKSIWTNYDYHSLFRSFFCFIISSMSLFTSIIYWNDLITNPFDYNLSSYIINNFVLYYMVVDLVYFIYTKKIRIELILHHIMCFLLFNFFSEYFILTFCTICEIISAFNWIGILFPNYEWISKFIRLFCIILVRLWIWIFIIILSYDYNGFYICLFLVLFFIFLDIYWLYVIYINYKKYSGFIKKNIKDKKNTVINKIKNKQINFITKINK